MARAGEIPVSTCVRLSYCVSRLYKEAYATYFEALLGTYSVRGERSHSLMHRSALLRRAHAEPHISAHPKLPHLAKCFIPLPFNEGGYSSATHMHVAFSGRQPTEANYVKECMSNLHGCEDARVLRRARSIRVLYRVQKRSRGRVGGLTSSRMSSF